MQEARRARKVMRKQRKTDEKHTLEAQLKEIAAAQSHKGSFHSLDNAALLFPSSETAARSNLFRLTAVMTQPVDPVALQWALNDLVPRFPTFTSAVKRGFFWFYLEPASKPLLVAEQTKFPCRRIPLDTRHALIRVTYFSHEISVEFFHSASDGNGGLVFLNSLVAAYLKRTGVTVTDRTNCLNHLDKPNWTETEDSFTRFADRKTKRQSKDVKAYDIPGHRLPTTALILTKGTLDAAALNAVAKEKGLTVSQFLVAALIWAIHTDRSLKTRSGKKPIVVTVPVNLRKLFPSETLRNFVSLMPVVSDGSADFEAICACVKGEFEQKLNVDYFMGLVNFNVAVQENPWLKCMPLPLKTAAMRIGVRSMSDCVTTTMFSNLGIAKTPAEFADHVVRYEFSLSGQSYAGLAASAVTFHNRMVVTIARTFRENDVERLFFGKLAAFVPVAVETNHQLEEGEA